MMTKEDREELQLHIKHIQEAEKHTEWVAWASTIVFLVILAVEVMR